MPNGTNSVAFIKRFISSALLLTIIACESQPKTINREKLGNHMTDDAYVYFRNLRQTYYRLEEYPEAGIRIYRHKDLPTYDSTASMVDFGILVNWKYNKAYFLLQPAPALGEELRIFVIEPDELVLSERNQQQQLLFSAVLFEALSKGMEFRLEDSSGRPIPFLKDEKEREAVRITCKDFYKLTRVL